MARFLGGDIYQPASKNPEAIPGWQRSGEHDRKGLSSYKDANSDQAITDHVKRGSPAGTGSPLRVATSPIPTIAR